jgi:hypothetical protein
MRFAMEVQWRKLWTLMFRATELVISLCVRFVFVLANYFNLECQFLAYMADNRTYLLFLYQCYIEYNLFK